MYLNTIVVEDEAPSRELLIEYVIGEESLNLGGVARNGREALEKLKESKFDLCFLDINLPFLNGLQVLEQLDYVPYIIFTTVYREYALEAFDLGAVDYLLKPISRDRFRKAVEKATSMMKTRDGVAAASDGSRSDRATARAARGGFDALFGDAPWSRRRSHPPRVARCARLGA